MDTGAQVLIVVVLLVGLAVGAGVGWLAASARQSVRARGLEARVTRAEAAVGAEQRAAEQRIRGMNEDQARLAERFHSLAGQALAANNEQFLGLAEQRLRASQVEGEAQLARREESVRTLVAPLAQSLERVREQVTGAEQARAAGAGALQEQVRAMRESSEALRSETNQLVTALRSSQVRGAWGELQLRRVVESAGMLSHVDFVEQAQVSTDDGALRPDMVIRLAGGKNVVVDSKVAFLGYLDAQQSDDPTVRAQRMAAHARHFRKHVDDLGAKRYWDQFSPAPEFVVMFVPAESFLSAAVEQDPSILEYAVQKNVVIATPMTMVALLRTVAYAWRQDALATNAQQVLTLGKELHGRLTVMGGHLAKLGRGLQSTADAYNRTVGSLETRVLVSARRFADLGVVDGALDSPPAADLRLTSLSAPELLASVNESVVAIDEDGDDTAASA
ncbi:DNA recombination protein RmuC [Cellulomonas sp. PhB143]|uniref:DNA recombination protein RmuC n=1 Tax=Cellulomonas sp. PhB143 TaxID=2485186 RepID=UPI000F45F529|nr:DNA recombination protein RmuC [Cellulomonas sp. PhB143]ROS76910.1 DNA recombination protein RmuC [Cellulomonas sp. PhB143]